MIGILAYGSLLSDPGSELKGRIASRKAMMTPFLVEFARISSTRDGAPTLVPVDEGGSTVSAQILVLVPETELTEAKNMLYRREIRCPDLGRIYNPPDPPRPNSVLIKDAGPIENLNHLLYVDFPTAGKLATPTPSALATAAIGSARRREDGRDGITYLHGALRIGIRTPLSDAYASEICRQLGVQSLDEALNRMRSER